MMTFRTPRIPLLALLVPLILARAALAETTEEQPPVDLEELSATRKVRAGKFPISSRVSRYQTAALKAADEGNPGDGIALLDKLNLNRLNPLERAQIYQQKASLAYASADYDAAIENFENVLAEEVQTVDADSRIRFNIAQIYVSLQRWSEVVSALHRWFRYVEDPDPIAHYLLGIAHYQLGEVDQAIADTETAVDLSPEPPENWLQLLSALYIQKEDYPSATPVLEELVMRFLKKQYWVQLSLIYGARDDYRHSLAVQQVAYAQGLLTEDKELLRLARSYLYHDLPQPAARVLQSGLDSGMIDAEPSTLELLANSWIAAREYDRSLPILKRAAEISEDGNLFVRLGQVHLQREEWGLAAESLVQAIEKGGLDKPGNAELLSGIAYFNDGHIEKARFSFLKARHYDSTRAEAEVWIAHIEKEAR